MTDTIVLFAVKGGQGTTVCAAALAARLAQERPVVVLDAGGGDVGRALGLPTSTADTLGQLLDTDAPAASVWRLVEPVDTVALLGLLQLGHLGSYGGTQLGPRWAEVAEALGDTVVVDAGTITDPTDPRWELVVQATRSYLVVRPCYLGLARAINAPVRADGLIVMDEPDRVLDARGDAVAVLGLPLAAVVPWSPAVARAVDAGLLGMRPQMVGLSEEVAGVRR
jgi:hypothetical protein